MADPMSELAHSSDAAILGGALNWQARHAGSFRIPNPTMTNDNMQKVRRRFVPRSRPTLLVLDLLFMAGAITALVDSVWGRLGFGAFMEAQVFILCVIGGAFAFAFAAGCYRYDAITDFSVAVTRLSVGLAISAVFLVPAIHLGFGAFFHSPAARSISRETTILALAIGAGLTGGIISRTIFLAMARRQWFRRSILVVGSGERAHHLYNIFSRPDRRLDELHFLTEEYLGGSAPQRQYGDPIKPVSGFDTVDELEKSFQIDQVVVAVDHPSNLHFDHLLPWKANGIPVFDFSTFLERETGRVNLNWTDSDWLLYSEGFRFGYLDLALKRTMDVIISALFLFIALPALLVVALAIAIEDFGPVFYRQERVSQNNRSFKILKFRTMRTDAEKFGPQWADENDPRITKVGRFLRRSRIDEIPQLINVLRGEMALVGPRPERPVFVENLSDQIRLYRLRHSVKAGVTGWAQINYPYGASVEDARNKLEYDLYYLKHFSVLRDISIMLQTIRVLVFAQGSR